MGHGPSDGLALISRLAERYEITDQPWKVASNWYLALHDFGNRAVANTWLRYQVKCVG